MAGTSASPRLQKCDTFANNQLMMTRSLRGLLFALTLFGTLRAQQAKFFRVVSPVAISIQSLTADGFLTWTNPPTDAVFKVQTASSLTKPIEWADYIQVPVTNTVTVHRIFIASPPPGMALIPAGSFTMGDSLSDGWAQEELPAHSVFVSAVYMERYEVTKTLWNEVFQWAVGHGYTFDNLGSQKGFDHPVQAVNWYDVVKWCNARSEKEGKVPAYYTNTAQTVVYRTGKVNLMNDWVKWDKGYRLPTEAEWEKAARGGLTGKRFPQGGEISHTLANYASVWGYDYDVSPTQGFHPTYKIGNQPYTSPVGSFAANGYGLYDMVGNVRDWCWDWYGSYPGGSLTDPRGPSAGTYRVIRGGCWRDGALHCRVAYRGRSVPFNQSASASADNGFRCVLPLDQ